MSNGLEKVRSLMMANSMAIAVETANEEGCIAGILEVMPDTVEVCIATAGTGPLISVRLRRKADGTTEQVRKVERDSVPLPAAYHWAQDAVRRLLIVLDAHTNINNAGSWRALVNAKPGLKNPKGARENDPGSMVVFLAPQWELSPQNPLRGHMPVVQHEMPDREEIRAMLSQMQDMPTNGEMDPMVDALCGIPLDRAEQVVAEAYDADTRTYRVPMMREARKQALREAGLSLRPGITASEYGGMGGLRRFIAESMLPYARHPKLAVRRLLFGGVPGVGKTLGAQLIAGELGCECIVFSLASMKDQWQGSAARILAPAFRTVRSIAKHTNVVCVLDELDTLTKGHAGDSLSGDQWKLLSDELQYDDSKAIYIGTLNYLDKLDPAMVERFGTGFFFDMPSLGERTQGAAIHYLRLGASEAHTAAIASATAGYTDGFSFRVIAEQICPDVLRAAGANAPTPEMVARVITDNVGLRSDSEAIKAMRNAGKSLPRRANDPEDTSVPTSGRRLGV